MKTFMTLFALWVATLLSHSSTAQSAEEQTLRNIFNTSLVQGQSYPLLEQLTTKIGPRLSGSPGAAAAVEWARATMKALGFDTVYLQPVMVPHWVRGKKEIGRVISNKTGTTDLHLCALGNSIGTGPLGISAPVVEVKDFNELKQLGIKAKGKIVFFNRPFDPTEIHTFAAYSKAVDQRATGPSEAAKYGAVGTIVRSMSVHPEDYPHTGSLQYQPNVPKIPAVALSTNDADKLSAWLKTDPDLRVYVETHCEMLPDAPSFNVIGELRGSKHPNEIILVSGHLDSWDIGQGAHDDGAGCVQAMETLRIFKALGYRPQHTLRAVLYMNEENGLRGGKEYARVVADKSEKHIAAIESDRGGFVPRGFTMTAKEETKAKIKAWKTLMEPYGLTDFGQAGGGADIGPLGPLGTPLIGYLPDSQRYFRYHHTEEDTLDKVDKRELELGSASIAALVYLIDTYGL